MQKMKGNSTFQGFKKFYIDECLKKVRCDSKAKLVVELMAAMGVKTRMAVYYRRKNGFVPKRGEDEKILAVLEKYEVKQYLIEK